MFYEAKAKMRHNYVWHRASLINQVYFYSKNTCDCTRVSFAVPYCVICK